MGNGAGAVCWGAGGTGSPGARGSREEPGWSCRVRKGPRGQVGLGGQGARVEGEVVSPGSAGQGGFSRTSPGSSLLSSTSPLFMPLPPRMPNLAHAICRLSSEIGTGTKAERLTCITSLPLPLHEEREGQRAGGASGQPSTFNPIFLLTLAATVPDGGGFPRQGLEAGEGFDLGKIPGPGLGGQTMLLSPGARWHLGGREPKFRMICRCLAG